MPPSDADIEKESEAPAETTSLPIYQVNAHKTEGAVGDSTRRLPNRVEDLRIGWSVRDEN